MTLSDVTINNTFTVTITFVLFQQMTFIEHVIN